MRAFAFRSMFRGMVWAALLLSASATASAQWLKYPDPGTPRTADGKPNLSAPAPKTPDGHPDLSGIWLADDNRMFFDLTAGSKQEVPFQPWAKALSQQRQDDLHKDDPLALCMPPGVPRINTIAPFKIIQNPRLVIVLYETTSNSAFRQIFTDGRPLPQDPQPTWLGYSVGKWEGDALRVDTTGFNGRDWLDTEIGRPGTEALHVIERFHRLDFGHMEIAITIDDPKAYTAPWSSNLKVHLLPDTELLEMICENQRGIEHLVGK